MVAISIILPTFNRATFLQDAFKSLSLQKFKNFEVIIIDDGSIDNTEEIVNQFKINSPFPIRFLKQTNMGPAIARNNGIKLANSEFIAFFDSDDTWEDDHLSRAMSSFELDSELEWVYFACRRIDYSSKNITTPTTFYTDTVKNPLFNCVSEVNGELNYLDFEKATICQILSGLDSGLQNAVFKKSIFDSLLLQNFKVGEDRLFILQLLKKKYKCAFIDKVTVNYYVHSDNTSDTNLDNKNIDKRVTALKYLIQSYEATTEHVTLNKKENTALRKRLSEDYIWKLGYSLQRENGMYTEALTSMKKGISHYPFKLKYWKTLLITYVKWLHS